MTDLPASDLPDALYKRVFSRITAYIAAHPDQVIQEQTDYREVVFENYCFMLYNDGAFFVSERSGPNASIIMEVEEPGTVLCHSAEDRLLNELLPALDRALLLDDLAGIE